MKKLWVVIFMLAVFILLSLVLNWPYLKGGFAGDDLLILNTIHKDSQPFTWWKGFWAVTDIPDLTNIWWKEAKLGGGFWRPVPSYVFLGFIRLLGENAFPLHLLSILLHGCIAFLIFLIVRRLTQKSLIAFLSGLFFLACEDHSMVIGWIATNTDILCVFFITLSLLFHMAWLKKRRPFALVGSLITLALALGCKESAAVAPLVLILMTFLMPGAKDEETTLDLKTIRKRIPVFFRDWLSWVPSLVVLFLYLGFYSTLKLGGMNNLMYIDPLASPARYLSHLVLHLPIMWLATLSPIPPSLFWFFPSTLVPLAVAGLVLFALWIWALFPFLRRPLVLWALIVYLLALLPQMGADASERGLYFPLAAAGILLAISLVQINPFAKRLTPKGPRAPLFTRGFGWYLLVGVLASGLVLSAYYPFIYVPSFAGIERDTLTAQSFVEERKPDHVLVLNTGGPFITFYMGGTLEYHLGHPVDVRVLSACNAVVSVERTGDASFIIRSDRKGWLSNTFAKIFRTDPKLQEGKVYQNNLFSATLLELVPDATDVLAVRFDIAKPLDDHSLLFLYWDGERFLIMDFTTLEEGKEVILADTSDVWASMM
ncbi:MAG: hypothetical protein GTO17_09465 [Candidatus Aminicenantes bacterium]|nr:hypothetical protein [Candidatus Aminicenantes bacterium]